MALIGEAAVQRDLGERQLAVGQQLFGPSDAALEKPAIRGYSHRVREGRHEMPERKAAATSNVADPDRALDSRAQLLLREPFLPRRQPRLAAAQSATAFEER